MDAEPIEAEVVAPAPPPVSPATGGELVTSAARAVVELRSSRAGAAVAPRHCLTFPQNGQQVDVFVSDREFKMLARYFETLNARTVAAEFSIGPRTVRNMLQSERLNAYVAWRIRQISSAAGLTMDKILAKLNGAIDGTEILSEDQISAIGHAARLLKPSVANMTFNQQNNFSERGAAPAAVSPYAKLGRDELLNEMREVVAEAEPREDAAT